MASITKRGSGWLVRVTRQGHPQINKTFPTRKDAEAYGALVESEIARGVFRRSAGEKVTFGELLERYLIEVTPTKRGAVGEAYHIKAILTPGGAAAPMLAKFAANLDGADVAAWRDKRMKSVKPATVAREWAILAHCLAVARLEWGMPTLSDCFSAARKPEIRNARDRRVSDSEIEAIVSATESPELEAMIRLGLTTAARRGELLSLKWRDIDLKARVAKLRQGATKNGHARAVPLSSEAVRVFQGLPRSFDGGAVFQLAPHSVGQAFRRAVARARRSYQTECRSNGILPDPGFLVGLCFHDLRHEACSRLAELGLTTTELAAISGHKTLQLVGRYTHHRAEDLARKLG